MLSISYVLWLAVALPAIIRYFSWQDFIKHVQIKILWLYAGYSILISLLCLEYFKDAHQILKYSSFFLMPIGMFALRQTIKAKSNFQLVANSYIFSATLSFIASFFYGLVRWIDSGNSIYITYNHLSDLFGVQPIYLSIYYLLAILFAMDFIILGGKKRRFYIGSILILILGIILLGSRTSLLIAFLIMTARAYLIIGNKKRYLLFLTGILMAMAMLVFAMPTLKERFLKFDKNISSYSGLSFRSKIWKNVLIVASESPLWGYGYTNSQEALQLQYTKVNFRRAQIAKMNAHNQYLQTLLDGGIIGLVFLLLVIFYPVFKRSQNFSIDAFFIIIILSLITESFFRRQFGVLFYTYFFSLFLVLQLENKKEKNAKQANAKRHSTES